MHTLYNSIWIDDTEHKSHANRVIHVENADLNHGISREVCDHDNLVAERSKQQQASYKFENSENRFDFRRHVSTDLLSRLV